MPKYGHISMGHIRTLRGPYQKMLLKVIQRYDISILDGKRTEEKQKENVRKGYSKTLNSKHVYPLNGPSLAFDFAPYPIEYPKLGIFNRLLWKMVKKYAKDWARFAYMAGYIVGMAEERGMKLRWGGNWNDDEQLNFEEQNFDDLGHLEEMS